MENKVPLNQVYKEKTTFADHPEVEKTYNEMTKYCEDNNFIRYVNQNKLVKGRRYDWSLLYHSADLKDKVVCELGGRDGLFSSWLTKEVKEIHVSDYFECWGKGTEHDLGQYNEWVKKWEDAAYDKTKLKPSIQDITKIDYPDNYFDVVICTSVIEHMFNQHDWMGDMVAIRELVRITKPGGKILLSTDMAEKTQWISGTLYYSKMDLFDRIINPSKCKLNGDYTFDVLDEDNTDRHNVQELNHAMSVVFSLIKPE